MLLIVSYPCYNAAMANKKKDEPTFHVDVNNSDNFNPMEAKSFLQALVRNFQQGAYCLFEALRLAKVKDKNNELDLILNDEEHSLEYKAKQDFPYLK